MARRKVLLSLSQTSVVIAVPVVLTVLMVRLVMSPLFLQAEYNRPGFPMDPYGFTTEERLRYAPPAVEYLLNFEDISFLADLRLPRQSVPPGVCDLDETNPALCHQFNDRELRHMEDVKVVTQGTYLLGIVLSLIGIAAGVYLARVSPGHLRVALTGGSLFTFGVLATIVFMALTAWDAFFTGFHRIFFEGDSWLFRYSDTLIRLFPEQFWFDAALVIGSGVIVGALIVFAGTWVWGRRYSAHIRTQQADVERTPSR